jgi:hypothetical protein
MLKTVMPMERRDDNKAARPRSWVQFSAIIAASALARATVMEMAGDYPQGLESMRAEGVMRIRASDIRRVEEKLAAKAR